MEYDVSSAMCLLSHIHTLAADFLQARLDALGLPQLASSHGFILYSLSQEERLTLSALSARINRDKSTTTVLVRKLADAGLVALEKDAADSRKKLVTLTETGKRYNAATAQISRELLETCYEGFSDGDKAALLALLVRLEQNIGGTRAHGTHGE